MRYKGSSYIFNGLFILAVVVMFIPAFSSCGKSSSTSSSTSTTQLLFANLSPDLYRVKLYTNNVSLSTTAYYHNTTPSYAYLGIIDSPLQVRNNNGITLFTDPTSRTHANAKYTFIFTGLVADSSFSTIFMVDTSTIPTVGTGKMRFVNASPRTPGLDVYANDSKIFTNIQYPRFSDFLQMPAGNYLIKIFATGDQTTQLNTTQTFTVSDGRLYTLYTYGLLGRTDTSGFNTGFITNK